MKDLSDRAVSTKTICPGPNGAQRMLIRGKQAKKLGRP